MTTVKSPFATIEAAIEDIRQGKMVVVCDDENRENEGDLTIAAQFVTPEAINFMAKEGRGLICLSLTPERCDELGDAAVVAACEPFDRLVVVERGYGLAEPYGDVGGADDACESFDQ